MRNLRDASCVSEQVGAEFAQKSEANADCVTGRGVMLKRVLCIYYYLGVPEELAFWFFKQL